MFYSPLRYPGGKSKLEPLIELLIRQNDHVGGTYIEPFAGGAGIALALLDKGVVNTVVINDLDKGISSFWKAILNESDRFLNDIQTVKLDLEEWKKQRTIVDTSHKYSYELGFATFYLNRTNRSGIIKGGVIGGVNQDGDWKMDARFNRDNLCARIRNIIQYKDRIHIYNKEVMTFLDSYLPKYDNNSFIYFDPPYYAKGKQLYLNFLTADDHKRIKERIAQIEKSDWVITYDDVPEIDCLYDGYIKRRFNLNYSVGTRRNASEIIIFKREDLIPSDSVLNDNNIFINMR